MRIMKGFVGVLLLVIVMALTGCSNVVRATINESEFISDSPKVSSTVALHLTDEFRKYEGKHVDWWSDATSYTMEVGPLASDWFRLAFQNKFESVIVDTGQPAFPYSNAAVDFIVTPEFTSFKAGGPVVVKFEDYWIELGMEVLIQDIEGNTLSTLELLEKGKQGGTGGFNPGTHVYPEVCRKAVKPLVDKTIDKLVELENNQ